VELLSQLLASLLHKAGHLETRVLKIYSVSCLMATARIDYQRVQILPWVLDPGVCLSSQAIDLQSVLMLCRVPKREHLDAAGPAKPCLLQPTWVQP
jgi:hypothetical protein